MWQRVQCRELPITVRGVVVVVAVFFFFFTHTLSLLVGTLFDLGESPLSQRYDLSNSKLEVVLGRAKKMLHDSLNSLGRARAVLSRNDAARICDRNYVSATHILFIYKLYVVEIWNVVVVFVCRPASRT